MGGAFNIGMTSEGAHLSRMHSGGYEPSLADLDAVAQRIRSDQARGEALRGLAMGVSADEPDEPQEAEQAKTFTADTFQEAISAALQLAEPYERGRALAELAERSAPEYVDEIIAAALATVEDIAGDYHARQVLSRLISLGTLERRAQMLDLLARKVDGDHRVYTITFWAPHLTSDQRASAIGFVAAMADENARAAAMTTLAPYLDADQLAVALEHAHAITAPAAQARALAGLVPCLPQPFQTAAVASAFANIVDHFQRSDRRSAVTGIGGLLDYLDEGQIGDLLTVASSLDGAEPSNMLTMLAPHLRGAQLTAAIEIARSQMSLTMRFFALSGLVKHASGISQDIVDETFDVAIADGGEGWISVSLIGLRDQARSRNVDQVLAAAAAMKMDRFRVDLVCAFAGLMSEAQAALAARFLLQGTDAMIVAEGLVALVPYLTQEDLIFVSTEAERLPRRKASFQVITAALPHLPQPRRQAALAFATSEARRFRKPASRAAAWRRLATLMPPDDRPLALTAAFQATCDITDDTELAHALVLLGTLVK